MKDREGANHHTNQPERAQPHEQHRYRVDHYGKSRNFAAYEGSTIIAVTLYRKGAAEITARLAEKDRRIAALESQLAAVSQSQVGLGHMTVALPQVSCCALCRIIQDPLPEECELHPAIPTALNQLQAVDVTFDRAIRPGERQGGFDGSIVPLEHIDEIP